MINKRNTLFVKTHYNRSFIFLPALEADEHLTELFKTTLVNGVLHRVSYESISVDLACICANICILFIPAIQRRPYVCKPSSDRSCCRKIYRL